MYRVRPLHIVGIFAFVTATVAGVAAQGVPSVQSKSGIIEKIIVKVNGEILTQSELESEQIKSLQEQQNAKVVDAKQLSTDAGLAKALQEITPQLLVDAVDDLLIVQYGRELGVKFTEDRFKQALDNVKKENKLDDKQFAQALKEAEGKAGGSIKVTGYVRYALGEGIEKQETDFAAEVAAAAGQA